MVTLPSSRFQLQRALILIAFHGMEDTAALGMGLPLVDLTTVTLMVAVAGGGVYLRPLC